MKPTTSAPATTAKPTFTPLVSPAKVTAACPFLGAQEVTDAIAGSDSYVGAEQAPGKSGSAQGFNCSYGSTRFSGSELVHLAVLVAPGKASPKALANGLQRVCNGHEVTLMPGIGEVAWRCPSEASTVVVLTAKSSHGETRVARLDFGTNFHEDLYSKLAKLVVDRL